MDELLTWRNDVVSRQMFIDQRIITAKEHELWFTRCLVDPMTCIHIGIFEQKKIGVCRYNLEPSGDIARVSLNTNPEIRGRGLASIFLTASINHYLHHKNIMLIALLKIENLASLRVFKNSGFSESKASSRFYYLTKPIHSSETGN